LQPGFFGISRLYEFNGVCVYRLKAFFRHAGHAVELRRVVAVDTYRKAGQRRIHYLIYILVHDQAVGTGIGIHFPYFSRVINHTEKVFMEERLPVADQVYRQGILVFVQYLLEKLKINVFTRLLAVRISELFRVRDAHIAVEVAGEGGKYRDIDGLPVDDALLPPEEVFGGVKHLSQGMLAFKKIRYYSGSFHLNPQLPFLSILA
jgi:hypothetical protein